MLESAVSRVIIKLFVHTAVREGMSVGDVIMPHEPALNVVILITLLETVRLRALSSLTEPPSSPGACSKVFPAVSFGSSVQNRNTSKSLRRAHPGQLNYARPHPTTAYKCGNAAVQLPGAASASVYSSSSILSCFDSSLSIPCTRALPSSCSQTASRILNTDYINRLCRSSLEDMKQNDVYSELGMPVSSAGVLCADQIGISVAGCTTSNSVRS